MIQLHPSDFGEIIAFGVEEKVVKEADGGLNRWGISGTKPFVNVNEGPFGFLLAKGLLGIENG
jgi:hypothetical protein